MSLRVRLALLVSVAAAVLITAGGLLFLRQLQAGTNNALDAGLQTRADALMSQISSKGSGFQDSSPKPRTSLQYEERAQVINGAGRIVDSSDSSGGLPLLTAEQLAQARSGSLHLTRSGSEGTDRLLATPVPASGTPPTVVVVVSSAEASAEAIVVARSALLVGGPVAVLLIGVGAWLLSGAALRPVERMRRRAAALTAGDAAGRLPVSSKRDEIARLGETLNDLLERMHDALTRQRAFVADAGHELRTPLTTLRAELELAARPNRTTEELRAAVGRASGDTDRLIRLAEDLLLLARADEPETLLRRTPMRLDTLAEELVQSRGESVNIVVRAVTKGPVTMEGDQDRLRQVLSNLLDNAARMSPSGGIVQVRVGHEGSSAILEVLDDGPGFPIEFLPHAFERFRRADTARSDQHGGVGLGLAIVASLVGAHGGAASAFNRPEGGACVRVEFPLTNEAQM